MNSKEKLYSLISTLLNNIDNLPIPNNDTSSISLNAEVSGESKTIIINILKMITNLCNNYLDLLHESNDYKSTLNKLTINSCWKSEELFTFYKDVCIRLLNNEDDKYELKFYILSKFLYFAKNTYNKTKMVNIIEEHIKELRRLKKESKLQKIREEEKLILYHNLHKLLKNIDNIHVTNNELSLTSLKDSSESKELLIHILKIVTENSCNSWLNLIHKYNGKDDYNKYLENMNNTAHMGIILECINSKSEELNEFFKDDRRSSFYSEARELFNFCSKILNTKLFNEDQKNQLKIDILKELMFFANNTKGKKEFVDIINEFIKNLPSQKSQSQNNKSRTGQKSSSRSEQEELHNLKSERIRLKDLKPLPSISNKSSTGGKAIKTKRMKQLFGKERCIYKKSGDRKEYVKYKGGLITVKDYKVIIRNKK